MTNAVTPILNPIRAQFRAARVVVCRAIVSDLDRHKILKAGFIAAALMITSPVDGALKPILPHTSKPPAASFVFRSSATYDSFSPKSYAQVATWVLPQAVIPMSCELKLKSLADKNDDSKSFVPKRKRASPLTIRASESQKEILRRKAAEAGLSVGSYMLAASLGSDYKPPVDKERTQVLLKLYREFRAQGNNLNQIARLGNSGKITQIEGESMLAQIAHSHLRTHREIMKALAHGEPEPQP